MDLLVPLLTLFTNYSEWKKKMIASLMRRGLYGVSIGLGEDFFNENDWLNECDVYFGTMTLALCPSLRYVSRSIEDQRNSGQDWTEPLERLMRIIIALWKAHPAP